MESQTQTKKQTKTQNKNNNKNNNCKFCNASLDDSENKLINICFHCNYMLKRSGLSDKKFIEHCKRINDNTNRINNLSKKC